MIYLGSRYETSDVTYVPDSVSSETRPTVLRRHTPLSSTRTYVWRSGDRLDILSDKLMGSPALWWMIMDANPGIIEPNSIRPGTVLRIP